MNPELSVPVERRPLIPWLSGWRCFLVTVPVVATLLYFRADPTLAPALRLRTILFNAFLFCLAMPAIGYLTRVLFGRFIGRICGFFYALLALFPMWLVLGSQSQTVFFPQPLKIFGTFDTKVLLFYYLLAGLFYACYRQRQETGHLFPVLGGAVNARRRMLAWTITLLFLLCFVQCLLRFGNYTPLGESLIPQNHEFVTPAFGFFGIPYSSCDAPHHFYPAGLFAGGVYDEQLQNSVINDRPTAGYLFSQLCYFFSPYIAARLELFVFYFLIITAVFLLAFEAGVSAVRAFALALIVMSCSYLLRWATVLDVAIHFYGAPPLLLYCLYKNNFFRNTSRIRAYFLYLALVCFLCIGYYPYAYAAIHVLCFLGFFLLHRFNPTWCEGRFITLRRMVLLAVLVTVPFIVKHAWVAVITHYNVIGNQDNRDVNRHYSASLRKLPVLMIEEPSRFLNTLSNNAARLGMNYITYERWQVLGILSLIALLFIPQYFSREAAVLLYSLLLGFFSLSLLSSLLASLWPHPIWPDNLPLMHERSNGGYAAMLFAQLTGIMLLCEALVKLKDNLLSARLRWLTADRMILATGLLIFALSFLNLYGVWQAHSAVYPLFPGGLSAFGW